jgi:hypothetical protein
LEKEPQLGSFERGNFYGVDIVGEKIIRERETTA